VLVLEYKAVVNKTQSIAIEEAIRTSQFVRNKVLRYWIDNCGVGKKDLYRYNTQLREEYKFVKQLNSHACQASVERVERAVKRFYDNCKSKKPGKKGYPRFQKDNRSVEYKTSGWKLHSTKRRITFTDKKGIGELKLLGKWDIHTYPVKSIKRVRLVRRADGYYCQFCIDVECVDIQPKTGNEIGLDVGLESFYTDSNGHHEPNPKFLRTADKDIKHAQRRIHKKKKGSNNRRKARARYSKKHLRVSRQRIEHAKRLARHVCKSNDLVAYEDLRIRNMVKCHNRAKSISDASWYQFRLWLEHFALKFGKIACAVPPHNTSQECCICGKKVKKELKERVHSCTCGLVLHRDINAAINILLRAKSREGHSRSNALGDGTSTLLGATLVEQVLSMIKESPRF
jgi:putative transposase